MAAKNLPDKAGKLQAALIASVSEKDVKAIVRKLVALAVDGDLRAADMLLTRLFGRADSGSKAPTVAIQNVVGGSGQEFNAKTIADRIRGLRDAGDVSQDQ